MLYLAEENTFIQDSQLTQPIAEVEEFDENIYADMNWNMGSLGESLQLLIDGYYGSLTMVASTDAGMLMTIKYNTEHIAEISSAGISGSDVSIYCPINGNICLYDNTLDVNHPKMLYFETESSETENTTMDELPLTVASVFGDDITFVKYNNAIEEDGKTIDICSVVIKDQQNREIPCEAYIYRDTKTLKKLVKTVDPYNEYDYSMTIQEVDSRHVIKPAWTGMCSKADESQAFDLFGAFFGMATIMSDQSLKNGLVLSGVEDIELSEEDETFINTLYDTSTDNAEYCWDKKVDGYTGYNYTGNGSHVTVFTDDGEHYFTWNNETHEYIEDSES